MATPETESRMGQEWRQSFFGSLSMIEHKTTKGEGLLSHCERMHAQTDLIKYPMIWDHVLMIHLSKKGSEKRYPLFFL